MTAQIHNHADGRHSVSISRYDRGRQLGPMVAVPAIKASRLDALATAVMLALGDH